MYPPALLSRITLAWFALPVLLHGSGDFLPRLNALHLSARQARQGATIQVTYEFVNLGTAPAPEDYAVFVHLRPAATHDPDGKPATGADFHPETPTFAWQPGHLVEERNHPLRLPDDFSPGHYRVFVGLFGPGGRIKLANDDLSRTGGRYEVAEIEVLPKDQQFNSQPFQKRWHECPARPGGLTPVATDEPLIQLESGEMTVQLASAQPKVVSLQLPDGRKLGGDAAGYPARARICREGVESSRTILLRDPAAFVLHRTRAEARYAVAVRDQGALAASFDTVFRCEGNRLRVSLENVREEPGFLLMDVWLPQLMSTSGPGSQLILPTQSGRLVLLDQTEPARHLIALNWYETDLCGALVGNGLAAAIRSRDWNNELEARASFTAANRQLAGGFAPRFALRADASPKAARIKLAASPSVEVCLLGKADQGGPTPTWVDAAKWLRQDVHGSPNPLYRDTVLYKIFCDSPGAKDFTSFDEALEVIRRVYQLAPWLKQVVYLVGWQYHGHDTGYPATDQINHRLGGLDGLRRLATEAAKLNAILSYHDNFDDAYPDSPQWNEHLIARDPRGDLQKGGVWDGGQSYILAFRKYAAQAGLERIRRTLAQMPVRDTYHLDVLSAVPLRRDYNPSAPESSQDSLQGKFAILAEFNRQGIDITSEGFTAPFVGRIGHGWHLWRRDETVFANDQAVPFIPMIYHGGPTTYGRGKVNASNARDSVLDGAAFSSDWTKRTPPQAMAEAIYLVVAPWTCLRERKMQNYADRDGLARVTYAAGTFVEADRKLGQWRVVVDGVPLIENGLVVVHKNGFIAAYAQTARHAAIRLPLAFQGKPLKIWNGLTGADLTAQAGVTGDTVELDLPAQEPVLME